MKIPIEHIEHLGNNIFITISNEMNFTLDSILLANFASPSSKSNVLEIGSGCGIIPLIWCKNKNAKHITSIEINKQACDMFFKSISLNNLKDRITLFNQDAKDLLKSKKSSEAFDMVVSNPPYTSCETASNCKLESKTIANHEKCITIEEIINIAYFVLKIGGYLCLCCKIQRLCDVIYYMRKYNIEPKLIQLVEYKKGNPPGLFIIKGKKNAKHGIIFKNNLIIQNKAGEYCDEIKKLYKDF